MLNLSIPPIGYTLPSAHGDASANAGGAVALLEQILDKITSLLGNSNSPTPSGDMIGWFPGLKTLTDNPHPMLVHFPIAFLVAFFALECYAVLTRKNNLRQISSALLYLGALSALAAAAAGFYASITVAHSHEVHELMEWHGRLGFIVASLATILSIWRRLTPSYESAMPKAFKLILTLVMIVALFFGADLGGFMVYQHGVGVKAVKQIENHLHTQHGG